MLVTPYAKEKLKTYQKNSDRASSMFGHGGEDIAHNAGCTACSAIITPNEIIVGNAGDSRAVLAVKKSDKF